MIKITDKKTKKMYQGLQMAITKALARHKLLGESIAIWKDGKVVIVPAKKIKVPRLSK